MQQTPADPILTQYLATTSVPCPRCKYNLLGVTAQACPECGTTLALSLHEHDPIAPLNKAVIRTLRIIGVVYLLRFLFNLWVMYNVSRVVGFHSATHLLIALLSVSIDLAVAVACLWWSLPRSPIPSRRSRVVHTGTRVRATLWIFCLSLVVPLACDIVKIVFSYLRVSFSS